MSKRPTAQASCKAFRWADEVANCQLGLGFFPPFFLRLLIVFAKKHHANKKSQKKHKIVPRIMTDWMPWLEIRFVILVPKYIRLFLTVGLILWGNSFRNPYQTFAERPFYRWRHLSSQGRHVRHQGFQGFPRSILHRQMEAISFTRSSQWICFGRQEPAKWKTIGKLIWCQRPAACS